MTSITATDLRSRLFDVLKEVSKGGVVAIRLNGKEVGRLVPARGKDWRHQLTVKAKMRLPADKAFAPLDDLWEEYR